MKSEVQEVADPLEVAADLADFIALSPMGFSNLLRDPKEARRALQRSDELLQLGRRVLPERR